MIGAFLLGVLIAAAALSAGVLFICVDAWWVDRCRKRR